MMIRPLRAAVFAAFAVLSIGLTPLHADSPGGKFDFNAILVGHLMDSPVYEWQIGGVKVRPGDERFEKDPKIMGVLNYRRYTFTDATGPYKWQGGIPLHLTKRVLTMFFVGGLLIVIMLLSARAIASNPLRIRSRFANFVELLVQFVRNDVVDKNMHGHGKGFEAYILSLFLFILLNNLFGLLPWPGITATGDIGVTASLAIITTLMVWVTGFRYQGPSFLWSFMPKGFPLVMAILLYPILFPLLFVLEIVVGPIAKGFALTIRLLANMTAGHVIILALIGFIFQFGLLIAPVSIAGAAAIYLLEIFVAFLQAFIFALLTAIFIGSVMHAH